MSFFQTLFSNNHPLGELFRDTFSSSSSWSAANGSIMSFSNKLIVTNPSNTNYSIRSTYDYTALKNHTLKFEFKVKDISNSYNGLGVGWVSDAWGLSSYIEVNTKNGVVSPFYNAYGFGSTRFAFAGSNLSCSVNDVIEVAYNLIHLVGILTIRNITTGTSVTYSPITDSYPATAKINLHSLGGDVEVNYVALESGYKNNTDILFIGDSITVGSHAGAHSTHYTYKVGINFNSYAVMAGGGDRTVEAVQAITNGLILKPKKVVILIGTNNTSLGPTDSSITTQLTSVINAYKAIGSVVKVCLVTPRNNTSVGAINSFISPLSSICQVIDTYTPFVSSGTSLNAVYDCGDGLHLSAAGHTLLASIISSNL